MNASAVRPSTSSLLLVLLLAALSLLLSHCRMVTDAATGVDLNGVPGTLNQRNNCEHKCQDEFRAGQRAAQEQFKNAQRACGSDKGCKKQAAQAHQQALDELKAQAKECKRGCYNEGHGGVGR